MHKVIKKSIYLICLVAFQQIFAQQSSTIFGTSIILDEPPPSSYLNHDLTYKASDYISLEPGFFVKPEAVCNILMKTDPKMVYYDVGEYNSGGSPDNNYGGHVGKLKDNLIVTQSGALQYEIPFDLPPGINEMTPKLSFLYNSQAGDGILGKGWSISGLSKISRTPFTYYHNNYTQAVSFTNDDQLFFEGKFLVKDHSGNFVPEFHSYEIVKPLNVDDINAGFVVHKPDGRIYEYGVSENSRYYIHGMATPIEWHIEKITDAFGNYIEFEYANDKAAGSFWPTRIRYTGNSIVNSNPFYEIRFVYAQDVEINNRNGLDIKQIPYRSDTQRKFYHPGGSSQFKFYSQITHQLSFVELFYIPTDEKIADFQFDYSIEGDLPELHLKGIYPSFWNHDIIGKDQIEMNDKNSINNRINPVKLSWGDIPYSSDNLSKDVEIVHPDDNYYQTTVFSVNMNEEKNTSDLVQILKNSIDNNHLIRIFKNETVDYGNGPILNLNFQNEKSLMADDAPHVFGASDVNGDGIDELCVVFKNNNYYFARLYSGYQLDVIKTVSLGEEGLSESYFQLADFTGNGLTDLVWIKKIDNNAYMVKLFLTLSHDKPFNEAVSYPQQQLGNIKEILVGDFAGNRRSELMLLYRLSDVYGTRIYQLSESNNNAIVNTPNINLANFIHTGGYKFLVGDYNADAKSDVLFLNADDENNLRVFTSNGNSLFSEHTTTLDLKVINEQGQELTRLGTDIYSLDLNSDGFTDISLFWKEDVEDDGLSSDVIRKQYRVDYLLRLDYSSSSGDILRSKKHQRLDEIGHGIPIDEYVIYTGLEHWRHFDITPMNFTGYGGGQILSSRLKWRDIATDYDLHITLTGPATFNCNSMLSQIVDAHGMKRLIKYIPQSVNLLLSDKKFRERTSPSTKSFPIAMFKSPINVVNEIMNETTENQFVSTNYYFGIGRMHKLGKGFLGFDYIVKKDLATNTATIETFEINTENYMVSLSNRESYAKINNVYRMINNTFFLYNFRSNDLLKDKVYFPYLSIEENIFYEKLGSTFIQERKELLSFSDFDDYGNPQTILRKYLNKNNVLVSSEVKEMAYDNFVSEDRRIIGLLNNEEITYSWGDEADVVKTISYTNDSETGFRTAKTIEPYSDKKLEISFTPDDFGNIQQETKIAAGFDSRITTTIFTADGRFPNIITNPEGHITEQQYNPKTGLLSSVEDENGLTTEFAYDMFRNLLLTTYPNGNQTRTSIGWIKANGNPNQHPDTPEHGNPLYFIRSRSSAAPEEIVFYDQHERPLRKVEHTLNDKAIYTDFKYYYTSGKTGLVASQSNPYFKAEPDGATVETFFDYDFKQRLISTTKPDGSSETIVFAPNQIATTSFDGQAQTKTIYPNGLTESIEDNSLATISYKYFADGQLKATKINDQTETEISYTYDVNRRLQSMIDPSLGIVTYDYNAFGDLTKEIQNSKETRYTYDRLGRMNTRTENEGYAEWLWDSKPNGKGKLGELHYTPFETANKAFDEEFTYTQFGQIETHTISVDELTKSFHYTYDALGRLKTQSWPSGFSIINYYDERSFLRYITTSEGDKIYEVKDYDHWQHINEFTTADQISHYYTYSMLNGTIENIKASHQQYGLLQEFAYSWDPLTGNMDQRTDVKSVLTESFTYDDFNRLTHIDQGNNPIEWASYSSSGRIESKVDAGTYQYIPGQHYAVDKITAYSSYFPSEQQDIIYTSFNKIKSIREGSHRLDIAYNPQRQRIWQSHTNMLKASASDKYYFTPAYELEIGEENQQIHRHYLSSPTGIFAIFTIQNESEQMHYVLKDHQGSLTGLANASGQLSKRYSYDAFGRRRNANTWDYDQVAGSTITARGYTFHEHMDAFGLINMNGRVYDPLVGQMLSPDPFIQYPENSQSYNRYGYVLNNPLRFVDPSGYFAEGDSTGITNRPLMQLHLPLNEDAIPYITNTDIALSGPDVFSLKVEKDEYTQGSTRAEVTLSQTLLLSARASSIPPLAMIILGTGSVITSYYYLKENYAGEGFDNYPGPLSYTYEHPSQNPIHNPPNGFDPKQTPPDLNSAVKWLIGGRLIYEIYNEYHRRMKQVEMHPYVVPNDNTNIVQPVPVIKPYDER
jgi:RHS repeat-associated protein